MREGVPEVSVMAEDVTGEEGRDCSAEGSCIEHQDQYTHIWWDTHEPQLRKCSLHVTLREGTLEYFVERAECHGFVTYIPTAAILRCCVVELLARFTLTCCIRL